MPLLFSASSAHAGSYFNAQTSHSTDLSMFPKWNGMVARTEKHKISAIEECSANGRRPPCGDKQWEAMLSSVRGKPIHEQMTRVNSWANAHPYIVDQVNWGMEDYWETLYEFVALSGDCEDYAIAKYYSLRALGVPRDKLRIVIVQDFNLGGIIHAVLAVDDDDKLMILDNQIKQVVPALNIYHYRPIYAINEEAWWAYSP